MRSDDLKTRIANKYRDNMSQTSASSQTLTQWPEEPNQMIVQRATVAEEPCAELSKVANGGNAGASACFCGRCGTKPRPYACARRIFSGPENFPKVGKCHRVTVPQVPHFSLNPMEGCGIGVRHAWEFRIEGSAEVPHRGGSAEVPQGGSASRFRKRRGRIGFGQDL